jgi:hypothetical protein
MYNSILRYLALTLLFVACFPAFAFSQVSPLPKAHSHNDYAHKRPLFDALDNGFCSVEADFYLVDGEFLVGHLLKELKPERTLEALYLKPLLERCRKNHGKVYPEASDFYLWLDLKTDGNEIYPKLQKLLSQYDEIITSYDGKTKNTKAVLVIITGDVPRELILQEKGRRYMTFDGRPKDASSDIPAEMMSAVSEAWKKHFKWNGIGTMPEDELNVLKTQLRLSHQAGRKVRYWAAPQNEQFWKFADEIGIDFLNTDHLEKLRAFLTNSESVPRIVNIINFIRQTEPRNHTEFSDEYLYQTVVAQVKLLNKHNLPGTFLLQYDALVNSQYVDLLKKELPNGSEIGAWWEITQPHIEDAGMKWRGRFPWDWHANVGFATGYTPQEREKLVDVYMEKFKATFGKYPASVGSWFIDAHTLAYLSDKYRIVASCNCKDQLGTDGYTLWGGYWNQAYYPSRKNAYMPAQHRDSQIPVPIFRMLGSDPIYQYESGSSVISLEPVYGHGGGSTEWVNWFFKTMFDDPALGFNYAQAGQENSFGWRSMQKGLEYQIPLLAELQQKKKIRVETLETTGKWFKEQYPVTPPTALSALSDIQNKGNKTVWFNSRFYRASILWTNDSFRVRDIHLFDEQLQSAYVDKAGTSTQCIYHTLPVIDGGVWSKKEMLAGLRLVQFDEKGKATELLLGSPVVQSCGKDVLQVETTTPNGQMFRIIFREDTIEITNSGNDFVWGLELKTAKDAKLPFTSIAEREVRAKFDNFDYAVKLSAGSFEKPTESTDYIFRIRPANGKVVLDCTNGNKR